MATLFKLVLITVLTIQLAEYECLGSVSALTSGLTYPAMMERG